MQYQVRAYRGQAVGPASPVFLLQFGRGGGGGDAKGASGMKIAA